MDQQQLASPTLVATPTSTTSGGTASNATPAFSYDDLFPALPANNSAPVNPSTGPPVVRVTSSQKTHVSYIFIFPLSIVVFKLNTFIYLSSMVLVFFRYYILLEKNGNQPILKSSEKVNRNVFASKSLRKQVLK